MNTIKFTPITVGRTETSDVSNFGIIQKQFENKLYDVYSDFQLTIYVTNKCNADCPFCLNKKSNRFNNINDITDSEYLEMLEKCLKDFDTENKPWITLTGGEITKSDRLIKVLELINKYGFKIRTFNTNGSGLLDLYNNKELIGILLNTCKLHNINIKRNGIDDNMNSNIMKIHISDSNNEKLRKISIFDKLGVEIRLSCNLLQNGINNLEKIIEFKNYYNHLGYKSIMFREVDILVKNILKEIQKDNNFELLKEINGHYYTVYIYKYYEEIVKIYIEKDIKKEEIIRELVLYPDGILTNGYTDRKVKSYGRF